MHLSVLDSDKSKFEEALDLALTYIWTHMHNATIRVTLHHYMQDGKKAVNTEIKKLLKDRRFKWQTLKNDAETGQRIEIMEGANLEHKEQMDKNTAILYRRGLAKEDFKKHTLTL